MKLKTLEKWLNDLDPEDSVKIVDDSLVVGDCFTIRLPTKNPKPKFTPHYQESTGDGC
jgi:hypothetical protein